ncbi:MAG TPA: energy transducer TonB [Gemmatimonadaceae bacterium]|nr:energy transducer TonB [Gemmatimonadaceae bacterium]
MLPESANHRRRSSAGIAWSLIAHAVAIGVATLDGGTDSDGTPAPAARADTIIYIDRAPAPSPVDGRRGTSGRDGSPRPAPGPTLPAVPTVPVELPPIDPERAMIDENTWWATGDAERLLSAPGDSGERGLGGRGRGSMAFAERGAVALPGNPRPRYPDVLRAAAIEGRVLIEGVIDTTGALEPASIRVVRADHPLFEAAVRAVLPRLRFVPAEVEGRRVRMSVGIPFEFRIDRTN